MKIAIIGSGISGMAAAHFLAPDHDVTVYEAADVPGGHTATIDVELGGRHYAVDTGFIVYNDWTYPEFIRLLDELGVASQPTRMSFSVSEGGHGIEYAGSSLDTLFAQRRNLCSPRFLGMVRDILRFNGRVERHLEQRPECVAMTLGEYLDRYGYGQAFRELYLLPMGAAIWSSGTDVMARIPLGFFVRFFRNHGLLNLKNRPQWRVIRGGSREYIGPLTAAYRDAILLGNPVRHVRRLRLPDGRLRVRVESRRFQADYDGVVFACHSDQALEMLADANAAETDILSAIPYIRNHVVLHTDTRLLPANRRCWSSWNVSLAGGRMAKSTLTYNMNILQGIDAPETFCVTLNQAQAIDPARIIGEYEYAHPEFTEAGVRAQRRWEQINGVDNTWFCGAYWRNGFHEDGVWSARRVADAIAAHQAASSDEQRARSLAEAV